MEYTKAKWTRYGGHVAKAEGEHNSWLKLFIIRTLIVPCSSSFPNFTVVSREQRCDFFTYLLYNIGRLSPVNWCWQFWVAERLRRRLLRYPTAANPTVPNNTWGKRKWNGLLMDLVLPNFLDHCKAVWVLIGYTISSLVHRLSPVYAFRQQYKSRLGGGLTNET